MLLMDFIRSDSGAVTTDYVMLSAMMAASGFTAINTSTVGVENLAGELDATLRGQIINTSFAQASYFDDFEHGAGHWIGGDTDGTQDAYGGILGPFSGSDGEELVTRTFDLLSGYDYATVEFEMHAIDSWDNEEFIIFVDGTPISSRNFQYQNNGTTGSWTTSDGNYSVTFDPINDRGHQGFNTEWTDQSYSVTVQVANPGPSMSVGFGSTLNQDVGDESWAVDNIQVISTNDPV